MEEEWKVPRWQKPIKEDNLSILPTYNRSGTMDGVCRALNT